MNGPSPPHACQFTDTIGLCAGQHSGPNNNKDRSKSLLLIIIFAVVIQCSLDGSMHVNHPKKLALAVCALGLAAARHDMSLPIIIVTGTPRRSPHPCN